MAAITASPYQSSLSHLHSTAASSSSSITPATISKKQENSAAVAAGRRRLEEFKRKKAAEKGKKNSATVLHDEAAQNVTEGVRKPLLPATGDLSVSRNKRVELNGRVSEGLRNDDIHFTSTQSSPSTGATMVPVIYGERPGEISLASDAQMSAEDLFLKGSDLKPLSSVGSSSTGVPSSNGLEQPTASLSETSFGKEQRRNDSGVDTTNKNRVIIPTAPFGSARPMFTPAPPRISVDVSAPLSPLVSHGKPEARNSSFGVHSSRPTQPSSDVLQSSFNHVSQKVNGGNLVMLDSKIGPNTKAHDGLLHPKLPQPGPDSWPKSSYASMNALPSDRIMTDQHTDGIDSTSLSSVFNQSSRPSTADIKLGNNDALRYSSTSSSFSTLPPSLGTRNSSQVSETHNFLRASFSEAGGPKSLPLPPPLFRPLISGSTFKTEPSLQLQNGSESGSVSSTLPLALPSSTSVFGNTLPPVAPVSSQFPSPVLAVSEPHENGKADIFGRLSPRSSKSVGGYPIPPVKVIDAVDQSHQLRHRSSGEDDFAMLEQHIEDLTQEKFSLQRGLDAARALAETLAQENSALTEDYNNQGALVNDLKAETERQFGEIRAQAVVVEKMKAERDKAVQESAAAVERSQALAAEVIGLEEKILRARSQELKLKREMESLAADVESQKRQVWSLDKDRANLKSLIEALQEEKGLLQAQIRKSAAGQNPGDAGHASDPPRTGGSVRQSKADACTSTDDFEWEVLFAPDQESATLSQSPLLGPQYMGNMPLERQHGQPIIVSSLPSRPLSSPSYANQVSTSSPPARVEATNRSLSASLGSLAGRGLRLGPLSSVIPPDQNATIQNINSLITELAEEKEALLKALRAESVGAAELRTLNAELSQKLEAQTQRLELAVAQSMAQGGTQSVASTYAVSRMGREYVDEGDEVVDRVLGWIIQLFPSGSSRRKRL